MGNASHIVYNLMDQVTNSSESRIVLFQNSLIIGLGSSMISYFKKELYLFIIFGCAGSSLRHDYSLVAASGGDSLVVRGLLILVACSVAEHGLLVNRLQ